MDVDGNGAITSVEMCLIMSEMMPEHSDLHNQNSFHSAIDMSLGVSKNPRFFMNINLIVESAEGVFLEGAMCFSNLQTSKKIFQITILNLKLKFSANNNKQQIQISSSR